jgi:hypothetical protein
MSDTDIDYSDNEFEGDDEVLEAADREEKDEDVRGGEAIAGEKKYNTIAGHALGVSALDSDIVTSSPDEHTVTTARSLLANVKPKQAKVQRLAARADAMKEWGEKLKQDEGMRVASGFKPKGSAAKPAKPITEEPDKAEPWRVKESIEHGYIKGDKSRLNETLYQFFNDFNEVVDALDIDHAMQRDTKGRLVFEDRMTIDRKRRAVEREDGQEENDIEDRARVRTKQGKERVRIGYGKGYYDKDVRIPITEPGRVSGASYNPARGDLLLAERITDIKHRAEEVALSVGPLMPELCKAVFENATARVIGESLGFSHPQASAVGNAMLQRALEAASDAYSRIKKRERGKLTYAEWLQEQPDGMPIPARKLKQAYDRRANIKARIIEEVDRAIALVGIAKPANDNLQQKPTEAAA